MKKFARIFVSVLLAMLPLSTVTVRAAADTCTWTGAVNANWNNGGNWSGCDNSNVPEAGDALVFPESASNKATINDFVAYSFTSIDITGSGYTLTGTGVTLTATTPLTVTQSATIGLNITYAPSMNAFIMVAPGQTLTVTGTTTFSGVTGEVNVGGVGYDGTVDFVGNVNGDAGTQFIAVNDATAIVRGASNTYTATTVGAESSAIFECRSATCFGNSANDIYMGNGQVSLYTSATYTNNWQTSVPSAGTSWLAAFANITISGDGTVNDPIGISQDTASSNLQFTGAITLNGQVSLFAVDTTANVRVDGAVSGSEAFSIGSGSFRFAGSNSYAGTNTVNSGAIVTVTNANGLGSTAGITNVLSGASLRFESAAATTVPEPLQVVGSGIAGEGAIVFTDEETTLSGAVTLAGDTTIGIDSSTAFAAFALSGVISGTGNVTLLSSASTSYADTSLQFTGASANTYVGSTNVQGVRFYPSKSSSGVIAVPGNLNITATATKAAHVETAFSEAIANTSVVTLTNNGPRVADLAIGSTATETIGSLAGDGEVTLGAQSVLNLTSNSDYTFAGQISKFSNLPAGDSIIRKQGTGTATFTGSVNTGYGSLYPVVQVDNGTLKMNSSGFTTAATVVASGSVLKGTGSLGATIVQSGGVINVGNSPGCMTLASLNLNNGATFTEEIAGATPCSGYDQTTVTGTADITNATLQVVLTTTPSDGQVYTILNAGTLTGTFSGLADGATLTVGGVEFRINYTATSVTLTKLGGTLSDTGVDARGVVALSLLMIATALLVVRRKSEQ